MRFLKSSSLMDSYESEHPTAVPAKVKTVFTNRRAVIRIRVPLTPARNPTGFIPRIYE